LIRLLRTADKLALNFGPAAARVLGPRQYARSWLALGRALPRVVRSGHLGPLDELMGSTPLRIRFMSQTFTIDCPTCDRATQETADDSHTFGLIRELFVRNCYLRARCAPRAPLLHVVDGGANRGLFSLFAAASGASVVAIEPSPAYCELIHHHMALNGMARYAVEAAILGECAVPVATEVPPPILSIEDVMTMHRIPQIDLLKLDIEGGEFVLFADPTWLQHVRAVTMEVHAAQGDPRHIVRAFRDQNFAVELRDVALRLVGDPQAAAFIYAEKDARF
jgi:hypothetical protein